MVNERTAKSTREKAAELRAQTARKEARRRAGAIAAGVLAAIVVVVAAGILIQTARHDQNVKEQQATAPPAHLTNGGFLVGQASAKVTIQIYEDFQCPYCRDFESAHGQQLATWAKDGTAKLEYHPIAFLDQSSSTDYSTRALNAAAAVINADPTAFVRFHALLFAHQPPEGSAGLSDTQLIDYAVQAGANAASVTDAITSLKFKGWTQKVTNDFSVKGFTGTPTILVNGKKLATPDALAAAVKAAGG